MENQILKKKLLNLRRKISFNFSNNRKKIVQFKLIKFLISWILKKIRFCKFSKI